MENWVEEILLLLLAVISMTSLMLWLIPCGFIFPLVISKTATVFHVRYSQLLGSLSYLGNIIYGGYCGDETSLSIPNRVIKLSDADSTAKAGE